MKASGLTVRLLVGLLLIGSAAVADQVTLNPVKDNTLYEDASGALSNGAGQRLFAGRVGGTGGGTIRRALLAFDVAGSIPAGSVINSVELTLRMSQTRTGAQTVNLHRVLQDWGEGSSVAGSGEGAGASSTAGDATWIHTFFDSGLWSSSGGAFNGVSSAMQSVAGTGNYTWGSTNQMVADVQAWLDNPGNNSGWILVGNESSFMTTKRFDSRESSNPPQLTVDFTPAAASTPGSLRFSRADFTVNEGDGLATITVQRTGGDDGAVMVSYATSNGTAVGGSDYQPVNGMLSWGDGDAGAKSFSVQVLNDTEVESNENLTLMLSNPTGGASLGNLNNANLTIVDDDSSEDDGSLFDDAFPDFRFKVTIRNADDELSAKKEDCIPETVCVSGAFEGRSELFIRLIGPRPNGFLHVNLVRFTVSEVEVEIEQLSTGQIRTYRLDALPRDTNNLSGLVDREAFLPQ